MSRTPSPRLRHALGAVGGTAGGAVLAVGPGPTGTPASGCGHRVRHVSSDDAWAACTGAAPGRVLALCRAAP
jgi:hypothetical protein